MTNYPESFGKDIENTVKREINLLQKENKENSIYGDNFFQIRTKLVPFSAINDREYKQTTNSFLQAVTISLILFISIFITSVLSFLAYTQSPQSSNINPEILGINENLYQD